MTERPYWRIALYILLAGAAVWAGFRIVLPVMLPFLIGLAVALALDPAVRLCRQRLKLPRWGSTGLCLTLFYALLSLGLYWLLRRLGAELAALSGQLPALLADLAAPVQRLRSWLETQAARLPDGFGEAAEAAVQHFFTTGTLLTEKLPDLALTAAAAIVAAVPDTAVFLLTAILSSFFISSDLPHLKKAARSLLRRLPPKWRSRFPAALDGLKAALGGWLKAQLKLMGCTFVIVSVGLALLGVGLPVLAGGLIALIDALPILGTGTVLIPWGLWRFVRGDLRGGLGLVALYGAAALVRTVMEPKLLGRQMGISPLLTLGAIYVGYRLFGVAGMLLLPIAVMLLSQLFQRLGPSLHW